MPKNIVTIYGQDGCAYCVRACTFLAQRGYAYDYRNLTNDTLLQAEFTERTGGATTVPQIFIGEELIGGHDDLIALPAAMLQAKIAGS